MAGNDHIDLLKDTVIAQLLLQGCTEIRCERKQNPGGMETLSFSAQCPNNAGPMGIALSCSNDRPFPEATTGEYVSGIVSAFIRRNKRINPMTLPPAQSMPEV